MALPATVVEAPDCQKNWEAIDKRGFTTGDLKMGAYSTPDPGWLACDGSAVSRTTYAPLFARIGTTYGVGDGSTTFNLPAAPGRSPMGAGTGAGLTARTAGQTLGEENHQLLSNESGMPAHEHNYNLPVAINAGTAAGNAINAGALGAQSTTNGTARNAVNGHNTVHPVFVINFFIKT